MKVAVFGHIRSGTTILASTLWRHLVSVGMARSSSYLGEAFNPNINNMRLVEHEGHLRMMEGVVPQSREDRFELFQQNPHDYIVKLMAQDTKVPGIVEWFRDNYIIIAIERRNPLAAYLSALIANRYNVWHVQPYLGEQKPDYQPFTVTEEEMSEIATHLVRYYQNRDALNPMNVLYYEDIENLRQDEIIRMLSMEPSPHRIFEFEDHGTMKLHSFREKAALIENLDAVAKYLENVLSPLGVRVMRNV